MPALALLALLPLVVLPQDPPQPAPPTPEVIEQTLGALKAAFGGKELPPKLEAVEAARDVLDQKVIQALAKGMKQELEVRQAVLEALRRMDHPEALKELHDVYKRDKEIEKDDELFPALLKAIGQHASPGSIAVLSDNPFKAKGSQALEARILGLGRIRDARSVEALFAMMQLVGRGNISARMPDFRLALMALTGVDKGLSRDAWIAWWNDNKKKFEVPKEMPVLPEKMQRRWDYYWGDPHEEGRGKKREERGGGE
jgi:hypothetical protein